MVVQSVFDKSVSFRGKDVKVIQSEETLSVDAGLLPIRQFDELIGLTEEFAAALTDPRNPSYIQHSFAEMTRMRIYGYLADYADQNDHDTLRSDAIFKIIAGREVNGPDLASQPTLSRFENDIDIPSLFRLRDVFINQFINSFDEPPKRITLDIDVFDDATHGYQQLTFFHGFYKQYQYQCRTVTCAENKLTVMLQLLHGTAAASLGADEDLAYLVDRLRQAWPDVEIHLRGDSGFGVPNMYDVCEGLGIFYTFGLGMNAKLKELSDPQLDRCIQAFEATGEPQRRFCACWYKAGSWPAQRWVIIKSEAHQAGTNRRAVVTNRPGAFVLPEATYDEYTDRGESENRNKELKVELQADRLSDHRFVANYFRLYMHAAALNLLVRLRQGVANSLPEETDVEAPAEALAEPERRRRFNRRREHDPLGEGHLCTWMTRVIKVAARVTESVRCVVLYIPKSWPHYHHYKAVCDYVASLSPAPS